MSNPSKKVNTGPKFIYRTKNYDLFIKTGSYQLEIILKILTNGKQTGKQYRIIYHDSQLPTELKFFVPSTKRLLQIFSNGKNFDVDHDNGKILLKIPITTSQQKKIHIITLTLKEGPVVSTKIFETLSQLRTKISKIRVPEGNINNPQFIRKNNQPNKQPMNNKQEMNKCIRCYSQEELDKNKAQITSQINFSMIKIKEQMLLEITQQIKIETERVKTELFQEIGSFIEEMKLGMKKQLKKQIQQQFWDAGSQNQKKGQLLFNMLRSKSENNCIVQSNDSMIHEDPIIPKIQEDSPNNKKIQHNQIDQNIITTKTQEEINKVGNTNYSSIWVLNKPVNTIPSIDNWQRMPKQFPNYKFNISENYINEDQLTQQRQQNIVSNSEFQSRPSDSSHINTQRQYTQQLDDGQQYVEEESMDYFQDYHESSEQSSQQDYDDNDDKYIPANIKSKLFSKKQIRKQSIAQLKKKEPVDPLQDFEQQYNQLKDTQKHKPPSKKQWKPKIKQKHQSRNNLDQF